MSIEPKYSITSVLVMDEIEQTELEQEKINSKSKTIGINDNFYGEHKIFNETYMENIDIFGNGLDNQLEFSLSNLYYKLNKEYGNIFFSRLADLNRPKRYNNVNTSLKFKSRECIEYLDTITKKYDGAAFGRFYSSNQSTTLHTKVYIIEKDLLLSINVFSLHVVFSPKQKDTAQNLIEKIRKDFVRMKSYTPKSTVKLIINDSRSESGFSSTDLKIKKTKLDIDKFYNDDFKEVHGIIIKKLREKNSTGLTLLHGEMGTGKTTFIRYLTNKINRNFILVNASMMSSLDTPNFINFLLHNKNSILIIEEAERLVVSRDNINSVSAISALLNLTDGILGDCLNMQIICTFNTDITNIDKALLRKGRLVGMYKFDRLSLDKTIALFKEQHYSDQTPLPTKALTLAEIFNYEEKEFSNIERKKIGFGN